MLRDTPLTLEGNYYANPHWELPVRRLSFFPLADKIDMYAGDGETFSLSVNGRYALQPRSPDIAFVLFTDLERREPYKPSIPVPSFEVNVEREEGFFAFKEPNPDTNYTRQFPYLVYPAWYVFARDPFLFICPYVSEEEGDDARFYFRQDDRQRYSEQQIMALRSTSFHWRES